MWLWEIRVFLVAKSIKYLDIQFFLFIFGLNINLKKKVSNVKNINLACKIYNFIDIWLGLLGLKVENAVQLGQKLAEKNCNQIRWFPRRIFKKTAVFRWATNNFLSEFSLF